MKRAMIDKKEDIPGIQARAYPLNEALLQCNIRLSYSDAIDMCRKSISGLILNKNLRDELFDRILNEFERVIKEKNKDGK
jgi:hypothetical protein